MLEPGDLILCTVEKIEGTIVFVKFFDGGKEIDGSIIISEIAPGRIRNLRDYVVPKKKIVCKVLRISKNGNVELSLRRVTPKEKKEMLEKLKQEKSYESIFKTILKEKSKPVLEEIKKEENLFDFIEESRENPKKLEKFVGKKDSEKILEALNSQKQKKVILKKEINLKTTSEEGLDLIKKILGDIKEAEIKYISAGKYSIKVESDDIKKADNKIKEITIGIEKEAKKHNMDFSIKEK